VIFYFLAQINGHFPLAALSCCL